MRKFRRKAVYFAGPQAVEVREEEAFARPDEVIVESRLIGISHGTELRFFRGLLPAGPGGETLSGLPESYDYPFAYGYMNAGVTEDGSRVFSFAPHYSTFAARRDELLDIPDDVGFDDAVLLPSVETALGIVQDARPTAGDRVLVVGLGMIGLLTAQILARFPLERIRAVDPQAYRRAHAEEAGVETLDPDDDDASADGYFDIAIDTSAATAGLQLCIDSVAHEGRVVSAGWWSGPTEGLDLAGAFHRKRLHLVSSQVSHIPDYLGRRWSKKRRFSYLFGMIRELSPGRYIDHRLPMGMAQEAFELIAAEDRPVLQAVLEP